MRLITCRRVVNGGEEVVYPTYTEDPTGAIVALKIGGIEMDMPTARAQGWVVMDKKVEVKVP